MLLRFFDFSSISASVDRSLWFYVLGIHFSFHHLYPFIWCIWNMFWLLFAKVFFYFSLQFLQRSANKKQKIIRLHILVLTFSLSVVLFFRVLPLFFEYRRVILVPFFAPRIRTAGVVAMVAKLLKSEGVRDNTISN